MMLVLTRSTMPTMPTRATRKRWFFSFNHCRKIVFAALCCSRCRSPPACSAGTGALLSLLARSLLRVRERVHMRVHTTSAYSMSSLASASRRGCLR
jgi:hypothetical protein